MADQKEKRKFPRFKTNLEVIFYDQKRTKGHIVDISQKGCLMTLKGGATRPVGSMITFRVFFEGPAKLEENTMPSISLGDLGKSKPVVINYPHAVKILALVARHLSYEDKPAMGIQIKDLDSQDLIKWNRFMDKIKIQKFVLPEKKIIPQLPVEQTQPAAAEEINLPTYTLSFKKLQSAATYLPKNAKDTFFIPSKKQKEGGIIRVLIIHPPSNTQLEFHAVIVRNGQSPKNETVQGVFAKYENLNLSLKNQIDTFLGQK